MPPARKDARGSSFAGSRKDVLCPGSSVELMSQRQDLKLQGNPIAERHAGGQEPRDDDGSHRRTPYPRKAARSMSSRRTRFLIGTPSWRSYQLPQITVQCSHSHITSSIIMSIHSSIRDLRPEAR
jgi:hypothetical protein